MSYQLFWENKGVVKRFYGRVDSVELLKAGTDTEGDERFDDYRYVINDFLGCDQFIVDMRDIAVHAAIDKSASRINPRISIAVVATQPEIIAAATQYAESQFNVYPTRIFATMEEARAWIAGEVVRNDKKSLYDGFLPTHL